MCRIKEDATGTAVEVLWRLLSWCLSIHSYVERLAGITDYLAKLSSSFGLGTSIYFFDGVHFGSRFYFRLRVKWKETPNMDDTLERAACSDWAPQLK